MGEFFSNFRDAIMRIPFIAQLLASAIWIWSKIDPIRAFLWGIVWKVIDWYRGLWNKHTHVNGEFQIQRGGIMLAITAALGYFAYVLVLPVVLLLPVSAMYYWPADWWPNVGYKREQVYLIQSEEIYPDDNIWAIRGCDALPCDRDTSIYYRVAPTLFNHIWSVANKGSIMLPDDIGSGVPTGITECWVSSYGIRVKALMRTWDLYPEALDISCDVQLKN